MKDLEQLERFCKLANREIRAYYGRPDSCVFSSGVVCDVLTHFGLKADPLRVEAALFHDDPEKYGCVLGSAGAGTRRPAAGKDRWHGHLVSLVDDRYLLDTTLDQVNTNQPWLAAKPVVIDLRETEWFQLNPRIGFPSTGLLRLFPDVQVRYQEFHHQKGFRSAGDFRPSRRREIVRILREKWDYDLL